MGAMESTVKSLEGRMGAIESEMKSLKDSLASREVQKVDKRLGWFGQIVALLIAGFAGAFFTHMLK